MSIAKILPAIEALPHTDKFQLMQILLAQLANEEGISLQQEQSQILNPGKQMAAILQRMAERDSLPDIADPVTWQRKTRHDRPLPGRK